MNHAERAKALFFEGYSCAQSVFGAYCEDMGMPLDMAMRLASSFGGGMGGLREHCGAVTGMLMAAGMLTGYADAGNYAAKKAHYARVRELAARFEEKEGTRVCRELLAGIPIQTEPRERTPEYYAQRPCARYIAEAAEILENYMKEMAEKNDMKNELHVRPARREELSELRRCYDAAKQTMNRSGNPTQWEVGYPPDATILSDIEKKQLFVAENDTGIHGAFVFFVGEESDYAVIEDGKWPNDRPYGVMHRVASDGMARGIFTAAVNFALETEKNLRIDTHEDNRIMQHVVEKHGFARCGIVYVRGGGRRIAYQREG